MKKRHSDIERFWNSCIPEPNSGCFLWLKAVSGFGYGSFRVGSLTDGSRRIVSASKFACELIHGKIPEGLQALHKCDNKICVNPDHLYIGTRSDNANDAFERGQKIPHRLIGESNPKARLSEIDVREILHSNERNTDLATRYKVSRTHIGYIKSGKSWGHLDVN